MLHEVLLALSGHPSPLFEHSKPTQIPNTDFPLLSPSERALLQTIGRLSDLHRQLRTHIEQVARSHPSTICRAVATSIQQTHLVRFQDKILDVESNILSEDASLVGAYDIVPLAGVVGEFDGWHRRMAWYWEMASLMQSPPPPKAASSSVCTGAALIDRLRIEQQTGFPDIEQAAMELSKIAETAWLRQLASWLLHGKLPSFGAEDFFVYVKTSDDGGTQFFKDKDLLPRFVTGPTASSILFIGKSLHQVRLYGRQHHNIASRGHSEHELIASHLQLLSALSLPVVPAQLARAVSGIRVSLAQNLLKYLLPMKMTLELLSCLKQFFLLTRGEFAVTLINAAESGLLSRQHSVNRLLQQDPVRALQGLSIKDAELHQTLSQTWKALASRDEEIEDDILEFARKHISLSSPSPNGSRPSTSDSLLNTTTNLSSVAFNDVLFPSAAHLTFNITAPLDLFISPQEMDIYSSINTYLLSIRRAHLRLSDLWRITSARRDHPSPRGGSRRADKDTLEVKSRTNRRRMATRKVWATCSATIFFVSEMSAYFEGEVIKESWNHFEEWVREPVSTNQADDSTVTMGSKSSDSVQQDPETLASGHRAFLASLAYALLLNDIPFTRELRSLLGNIDGLIAYFHRLLDVQQKLDLERDAGGETGFALEEEKKMSLELDRARKKVDSDLKSVVNRLRQLDHERVGSARYANSMPVDHGFEPWKGGNLDRLLMMLEFGRMTDGGFDIV